MLLSKHKKNQNAKGNRLLISINVLGSAGPIRFVVNEEELVATVIDTALKSYAREGRLPVLGSDLNDFMLYCPYVGTDGNQARKPISIFIFFPNFEFCTLFLIYTSINFETHYCFLLILKAQNPDKVCTNIIEIGAQLD